MADMTKALGSSAYRDWGTPSWVIRFLENRYGKITLDPCASEESKKANIWFGPGSPRAEDGLSAPWRSKTVFMNPPYGRDIGQWVEKARQEVRDRQSRGAQTVLALLPARTDTQWWKTCFSANEWIIFTGRIQFERFDGGPSSSPAFPSIVVVFHKTRRVEPRIWNVDAKVLQRAYRENKVMLGFGPLNE